MLDRSHCAGHHRGMGDVVAMRLATTPALPTQGEVFDDVRGEGRTLRVSWHGADGVVVLSMWRQSECTGSFRLPVSDLPDLLRALTDGPLGSR
jgi:hypothetical protein